MRRLAKTREASKRENRQQEARLSRHDSRCVQPEPAAAIVAPLGQAGRLSSAFDLDAAVSRCFGNHGMFQEMARHLCDEVDPLLEQMRTARGAGNAKKLADAAHRLQGTVLYLAAAPAEEAARCVETLGRAGDLSAASAAVERLAGELARLKAALRDYCPPAD
jgi:HPt (histidine-containing phosphotransfer) domain-containing protein